MKQAKNSTIPVMLPDTRGVVLSRFGKGNTKLGPDIVTYSKPAIRSCPGRTSWCEANCYAVRINGLVAEVHRMNFDAGAEVPDLPEGTQFVRFHVSGDFDSISYIERWTELARQNPTVLFWGYTRSWRILALLASLETLRSLPNVQLFASCDMESDAAPTGWRAAWLDADSRQSGLVCPEERGKVQNCQACGYCFRKQRGDVIFIKH
jgi:hypothetical protein